MTSNTALGPNSPTDAIIQDVYCYFKPKLSSDYNSGLLYLPPISPPSYGTAYEDLGAHLRAFSPDRDRTITGLRI